MHWQEVRSMTARGRNAHCWTMTQKFIYWRFLAQREKAVRSGAASDMTTEPRVATISFPTVISSLSLLSLLISRFWAVAFLYPCINNFPPRHSEELRYTRSAWADQFVERWCSQSGWKDGWHYVVNRKHSEHALTWLACHAQLSFDKPIQVDPTRVESIVACHVAPVWCISLRCAFVEARLADD